MYRSSLFLTATLVGTNIALVQNVASAKSAIEVGEIATAIIVEIKTANKIGSGILLQRQGDTYTVLTAAHVVNGNNTFNIKTADNQIHQAVASSIKQAGKNIDLAVMKFRSDKTYAVAKVGTSNEMKVGSLLYVAGFPAPTYAVEAGTLNFTKGELIGKASKANKNGYSLIYSNVTLPGMSGGAVLNEAGELVAIHGQGDRSGREGEGEKTGRNLGITIENFGTVALSMGVKLDQQIATQPTNQSLNATDYLLAGNEKDERGDYAGAIVAYNQAIAINPQYAVAYSNRGLVKAERLNDLAGALADYNQSIRINPQNATAYYNRGSLKENKFNDIPSAFADYNQAIAINPKYSLAYNNRGALKENKLNDIPGALADYNQAIATDPKNSIAYSNRGLLKIDKLQDLSGGLADYNQALAIDPKNALAYNNRGSLKEHRLKDVLGALLDYNQAIVSNPKNAIFYYNRGSLKENKLNDLPGALLDYNQAIVVNPKYAVAYSNRGLLKAEKLNDYVGALADYNKSIAVDPKNAITYYNRGTLKHLKLNDLPGALADYNQSLAINPKYAIAYDNRGFLKANQLNDRAGAIKDFRLAARFYREQGQTQGLQSVIEQLQKLGATE
jgi:tetratricopeptide (TPR) repeat protein/V8-like Glu-specific endopeptidase